MADWPAWRSGRAIQSRCMHAYIILVCSSNALNALCQLQTRSAVVIWLGSNITRMQYGAAAYTTIYIHRWHDGNVTVKHWIADAHHRMSRVQLVARKLLCKNLIRPPNIRVGGLMFYHGFFILSFPLFSFAVLSPSLLNGTQRKLVTWSEVSAIWKRMSKIMAIPSPYKLGPKNHIFERLRNLTATLTAYIFEAKHDIENRASALTTTRGLLHHVETIWTLVHKQLQTAIFTHPPRILHFYSLPGFTHALQITELNQTLSHGRR